MEKIIVTRHPALVEYLKEIGVITGDEPVITHATEEDVMGKDVIGVLPLSLASVANRVTEVTLNLTPEMRGRELSLDEIRSVAGDVTTYTVVKLYKLNKE